MEVRPTFVLDALFVYFKNKRVVLNIAVYHFPLLLMMKNLFLVLLLSRDNKFFYDILFF